MLSTSSSPNVRLRVPHRKKLGSPSGPPSAVPLISRHKSSSSKYASLAAGLSPMLVAPPVLAPAWPSSGIWYPSAAASCSIGGTSSLKLGEGSTAASAWSDAALRTLASSSETRSKTNMKS